VTLLVVLSLVSAGAAAFFMTDLLRHNVLLDRFYNIIGLAISAGVFIIIVLVVLHRQRYKQKVDEERQALLQSKYAQHASPEGSGIDSSYNNGPGGRRWSNISGSSAGGTFDNNEADAVHSNDNSFRGVADLSAANAAAAVPWSPPRGTTPISTSTPKRQSSAGSIAGGENEDWGMQE
jgi:hypothetical protein